MKKWEKPILQELDLSKTMDDMSMEFNAGGKPPLRCPSCCETYTWKQGDQYYCDSDETIIANGHGQVFVCTQPTCKENNIILKPGLIHCS